MVKEILTIVSAQAGILLILGFLSRAIYLHWLSKDLERFKDALKSAQEQQLRETQHALDKLKLEHQVRFSALHEKRFQKIEELHTEGRALGDALVNSLKVEPATRHERILDASRKTSLLFAKLKQHELFLPAAFVDEWEKELSAVSLALSDLAGATVNPITPDPAGLRAAVEKIAASIKKMNGQLTAKARELLEG